MTMRVVKEYLAQPIAGQVNEEGLVVWYDPEQANSAAAELKLPETTVVRFDGSFWRLGMEQGVGWWKLMHGQITRKDVVELCRISDDQATYLLRKLCQEGKLQLTGKGRGAVYRSP